MEYNKMPAFRTHDRTCTRCRIRGSTQRQQIRAQSQTSPLAPAICTDQLPEKGREDEILYTLLPDNKSDHMQQGSVTLHHIGILQDGILIIQLVHQQSRNAQATGLQVRPRASRSEMFHQQGSHEGGRTGVRGGTV